MIVSFFSSIFAFFSNSCVFSPTPTFFSNFSYSLRFGARSLLRTHVRPFGMYKRSYQPAHTSPPAPPRPTRPPPGSAHPHPGPWPPAARWQRQDGPAHVCDITRFSPRIDRIFPGEALNPFFGAQDEEFLEFRSR